MPLQNIYIDDNGLKVGNNQLTVSGNTVYISNTLVFGIGPSGPYTGGYNIPSVFGVGLPGTQSPNLYGNNNIITLSANSPSPAWGSGAIDFRVGASGGRVGITFDSFVNGPSDFGYIYYYDDHPNYSAGGSERGTLIIGVQNDNAGPGSDDQLAIESSGHLYLNPGTTAIVGGASWNQTLGNLYVGNNSVKYLVAHEGYTGAMTLRTSTLTFNGKVAFGNTTSNWINYGTNGVGAPTVTTRSVGTKLVLYEDIGATSVGYAIGVESGHTWFSAGALNNGFKWYANTTQIMISNTTQLGVTGNINYSGTAYATQATLTDGATINWATASAQVATVTIAGNRTVAAPTGMINGAFYALQVIQDATGSRTLAWNAVFKWAGASAPTLSTAANARDFFVFRSDGTNMYEQGRSLGVA